ncbi:MAG: hypothetical protein WD059_09085 [Balneolaceae bacterium]
MIKNPDVIDDLGDGTTIEFIEKDRPIFEDIKHKKADKYFRVKNEFESIK